MLFCLCIVNTESQWDKPEGFQGGSSTQPGQTEVHILVSVHFLYINITSNEHVNINIVFVFRALQPVLGWKLSVLRVIHITTTQKLEVGVILTHLKL